MNSRVYVYLTGGLGNQLFQLSAAISSTNSVQYKIYIDADLGKPRSTGCVPDLMHFQLPDGITVYSRKSSVLVKKTAGYLLRMGIEPRNWEKNHLIASALKMLGTLVLSSHFRSLVSLRVSDDVGYTRIEPGKDLLLIGYFQSYLFAEGKRVRTQLESIKPREISSLLEHLVDRAKEEKPIFVHFRFQDYLAEAKFGIPNSKYYAEALEQLHDEKRNIWVFSDDIELAKMKVPARFREKCFFVDDQNLSPAQLLHLFRHGYDYVIANSTFSWWGAMLRFHKEGKVITPQPWFVGIREPRELIPKDWMRVEAHHD